MTATDPTADRTITFPDSSGTVALVGGNVISNVADDTTPQLGGTLDVNSNDITGTGNVNLTGVITATSFVGDVTGNADTATSATSATTATTATNAQGLTGTPNITVGSVTASSGSFSGNVTVGGTLTYQDVTNMDVLGIGTFQQGIEVLANGLDVTGFSTFKTGVSVTGVVTATSFSGSGSALTGIGVSALSDGDSSISIASTDGSLVFKSNSVIVATMSSETAFFNVPINLNSNKITNLATPSSTTDGANKDYVDNQVAGDYPTGDYGDLSAGDTDAFGQVISDLTSFDCLTTPSGSLSTTDLGELT